MAGCARHRLRTTGGSPNEIVMAPRSGAGISFDRNVDEVPPLGPGAVVVPDILVAEKLAEDEPRVRAPLADAAVRGDALVVGDALRAVDLAELVGRLERPVVVHRNRPRDRRSGRDVAAALGALLLVAGRCDQLARELAGGANVDERAILAADPAVHLVTVRAERFVALGRGVGGLL